MRSQTVRHDLATKQQTFIHVAFYLAFFTEFRLRDLFICHAKLGNFIPSHDRYELSVLAKSLQLCLTLCDPIDCGLPGSSLHGILQTRILESVAIPSSRASSSPRDQTHICYSLALVGRFFTTSATWESHLSYSESNTIKGRVGKETYFAQFITSE